MRNTICVSASIYIPAPAHSDAILFRGRLELIQLPDCRPEVRQQCLDTRFSRGASGSAACGRVIPLVLPRWENRWVTTSASERGQEPVGFSAGEISNVQFKAVTRGVGCRASDHKSIEIAEQIHGCRTFRVLELALYH